MTVGELIRMPPEVRSTFYDRAQGVNPPAINSETASIEKTVEAYASSKIPLDDMPVLQEEILVVGVA